MTNLDWPIGVRFVDLAAGLEAITGIERYPRVRVFASHGRRLLGSADIWTYGAPAISVERLRDVLALRFGLSLLEQHLRARWGTDGEQARLSPTLVSIVLPSCDREDDLRRCLVSLVAQQTRHRLEIIVVDNRPSTRTARRVAQEFAGVVVVDERRPGLSYARNAGILHARGEIVVATDDDVVAPTHWIETLLEPFAEPQVSAVTGNVLPLELETEAQCRFESYGGLGKGFDRVEFGSGWFHHRRSAVPTWLIGATANAAFRAAIFRVPGIGLMDEALGAGTPTGCSEDTYVFYRILKTGGTIVYSPDAYVWHRHRASMRDVRRQIYAYSKGHVAYHLTTLLRDADRRALVRLAYSLPKTYAGRALARLRRQSDYPLASLLVEIAGNCAGPFALWRSRRRVRKLGVSVPEPNHAVSLESPIAQGPPR